MELLEIIRLSETAIRRNKSRSFLTILGMVIGIFAVITLVSLGTALRNYLTRQFEFLGSNVVYVMPGKVGDGESGLGGAHGGPNLAGSKLENSHVEDLRRIGEPISVVTGEIEMPANAKFKNKQERITVVGASPQITTFISLTIAEGRFFNQTEVNAGRRVAVIGSEVKSKLYDTKEAVGQEIIIADTRFKVIGTLESQGVGFLGKAMDSTVYLPVTSAQTLFGLSHYQAILVKFSDKDRLDEAKFKIKSVLLKTLKEDDFSLLNQGSILSTLSSVLHMVTIVLAGIAAISLLVGGIGIMNIMLVSVTERTREIGIRKAVGAKNVDILTQFLAEAVFLSLVGGIIGVGLGTIGTLIVGKLISANAFSWWSVFLALGVSSLVGIVFGVAPAAKASHLDPVGALVYE